MTGTDAAEKLKKIIDEALQKKDTLILAIDGRSASGKSTLTEKLSQMLDCNVIHTDDFYLQAYQRTKERLSRAGGNLDRERLLSEVLLPLKSGKEAVYRPFLCGTMTFGDKIRLPERRINIIEGSYSCHPELRELYDLTVFVTVDKEKQKERILVRNGEEKLEIFLSKWIPLEEKYFDCFDIKGKADIVIKT